MVPEGWDESLLDKVAGRKSGHTPDKKRPEYWNGGIKWVSLADSGELDDGLISETDKEISELGIANSSAVLLPKGTVVLSRDAGVGKSAILGERMAVSQHFIAWECDGPSQLHNWFLYYWLQMKKGFFERQAVGSTIKTIGLPLFKKLRIQHPPYAEQKKIAEILSTWDRAIEVAEAQLVCARTQKRALMQQLLTGRRRFPEFEGQEWKEVRLGNLVEVNPRTKAMADISEISFIKMEAVSEDGRLISPVVQEFAKSKKGFTQFAEGDVLVAKITPCFENGKGCHAVGLTNGRGAGSTEFLVLRAKIAADQRFVFHIVNSIPFRGRGELNMQGSAGQRRVPPDFIRLYPVFAPQDQAARKKIADVLDSCDDEIVSYEAQIAKLRTEKQALMQQLLTGKRRVSV